jgi:hypothetical protein
VANLLAVFGKVVLPSTMPFCFRFRPSVAVPLFPMRLMPDSDLPALCDHCTGAIPAFAREVRLSFSMFSFNNGKFHLPSPFESPSPPTQRRAASGYVCRWEARLDRRLILKTRSPGVLSSSTANDYVKRTSIRPRCQRVSALGQKRTRAAHSAMSAKSHSRHCLRIISMKLWFT